MALRNIVKKGDSILEKKCRKVELFDKRLHNLLDDMIDTLYESGGVGLASPQVGILKRVVVIDIDDKLIELVNPEIIAQSGEQVTVEGCLSCPDEWGTTKRPMNVTVKAQDRNGKEFEMSGTGLLAKAFAHEIDHLDGILFVDKIIKRVSLQELYGEE